MTTVPAAAARIALAVLIAAAFPPVAADGADGSPRYRGQPLIVALHQLETLGLNLIYSSAVVLPELVVAEEPRATDPRDILDQILRPLGLRAENGASGAILIVRAPPPQTSAWPAAPVPAPPNGRPVAGARLIEDIVVTPGHHEIVPQELGAIRSLDRDDVIAAPTLGSDPSRIVTLLPGIAAAGDSAAFNARGSESKDVSLILDGLELYDPFHLSAFQSPFSFVDGRMVDSVAFVGGGFTADRGDRHGGFLEMSSASPIERASTELEVGTLNSRVAYQTPTSFGPVLVSARYWYPAAAGDTIAFGADGFHATFGDIYAKIGLFASPTTTVTGHVLVASDHAKLFEPGGNERVDSSNGSAYLWFRVSRSFSPTVATDTVVSAGKIGRMRGGIAEPANDPLSITDDRNVRFVGVKNDTTWTLGGSQVLRGGLDVRLLEADLQHTAGPPGATSTVAVARSGAGIGAYFAYKAAISDRLITEAGLRWDRQTYTGDRQWSPRLDLVWKAGRHTEVRLGAGRFAQSQRIHELRIEDGETSYRPPEICEQLDLTAIHRFSKGWSFRVDAYRHWFGRLQPRYENLFHPLELFPEAESDRVLVAPESAKLQGVEVSLSGDAGAPLQWLANYTWSAANDVVNGIEVPRSWDQTHAGNFLVAYRWRPGWFLSAGGVIHTGWPTTPVTGRVVVLPDGSTDIEPVVGARNSARFPTYARLDLKTGRQIATRRGSVRVELSIANLTDRKNACCVDEVHFEAAPDGSVATSTDLKYWLGITPSLQVLWKF